MLPKICFILFFFVISCSCRAQQIFSFQIKDSEGNPVAGATVLNAKGQRAGITDSTGFLQMSFEGDSLAFTITAMGYVGQTIFARHDQTLQIVLQTDIHEEPAVFAYARKTKMNQAPFAVSVLNRAFLQRFDQASFVPAMNTVAGVKMDERSPGSYRISIRGNLLRSAFGVRNVKVYLNGLPFTDASGNTYFNTLALTGIDKVEILKGPGGSMYGAGTGGVILLSNDPVQGKNQLQVIGGSYSLFSIAGNYGLIHKKTKQALTLSHQQSDGYRDHTQMRRDAFSYTIIQSVNTKSKLSGNIFYSNLFYQTPGGLTAAQVAANPQQSRPAAGAFKSAAAQKAALYISNLYSSLSYETNVCRNIQNNTGIYFSSVQFANPSIRNYEEKNEAGTGVRTLFTGTVKKISFAYGGEYQYSYINTSTYGNLLGRKDSLQYHDKIHVQQINIFAQVTRALPYGMELTGGISYNRFYYGFYRVNVSVQKEESPFTPQYIPRITLSKKMGNAGMVYLAYSKGYSPPTVDEIHASNGIFNKNLSAERGKNYEVGLKRKLVKNILSADIAYYIFKLQHTIVSRRDASGAEFFVNAGETRQNGLEYSILYSPNLTPRCKLAKFSLQATGTNVRAVFGEYQQGTEKYTGNFLTGTSPFIFSLLADVQTAKGIYSNITYTYTDKIPLNDANVFFAKAYNLLFLKIGYQKKLSARVTGDFFATANRSFNKGYSAGNDLNAAGNRFYNPAALQSFSGGLRLHFPPHQ